MRLLSYFSGFFFCCSSAKLLSCLVYGNWDGERFLSGVLGLGFLWRVAETLRDFMSSFGCVLTPSKGRIHNFDLIFKDQVFLKVVGQGSSSNSRFSQSLSEYSQKTFSQFLTASFSTEKDAQIPLNRLQPQKIFKY